MGTKKVFKLLGLARKANKLAPGGRAVQNALIRKQVRLLILASDASPNVLRKIRLLAGKCPTLTFSTKTELGAFFGREKLATIAVLDDGFARGIRAAIKDQEKVWTEHRKGNDAK